MEYRDEFREHSEPDESASDLFALDSRVRVAGNPARAGGDTLFALNMQLDGIQELLLAPNSQPRWSDETLGSSERWLAEGTASDSAAGIFRVWSTVDDVSPSPARLLADISIVRSVQMGWTLPPSRTSSPSAVKRLLI